MRRRCVECDERTGEHHRGAPGFPEAPLRATQKQSVNVVAAIGWHTAATEYVKVGVTVAVFGQVRTPPPGACDASVVEVLPPAIT